MLVSLGAAPAQAMPMFARKYKIECAMCHAAVPRLNYTGFKFKSAGYRMPWEVGKEQNENALRFENSNAFIAILNAPYQVQLNHPDGTTSSSFQFNAQEVDIHPLTGSWGKWWGSGFEVDALPDGTVSVNQGFLSFTDGTDNSFWSVQGGLFPNFLSYGALDRPLAISTPLVLSATANNPALDTLFSWAGPRAAGLTGSYWIGDTYLSASVRNRLVANSNALDALGSSTGNFGDFLFSATHFFDRGGSGSAVSLAYYKGLSEIPMTLGGSELYGNSFNHLLLSANYYLTDRWNITAGAGWGQDQLYDTGTGNVDQNLYHAGTFVGLEYFWNPQLASGIRYDQFTSDLNTPDTGTLAGTLYLSYRPIDQVILSGEYQYLHNEAATPSAGVDESVLTAQVLLAF